MGDLNFRLDEVPHAEVLKRVKSGDIEYLKQFDQVSEYFNHFTPIYHNLSERKFQF